MNKARRKDLTRVIALIEEARGILETVKDEEQEALDNMPEGLQQSERGETMEQYICTMEEMLDALDTNELEDIVAG